MKLITKKYFDYNNESEFITENVTYHKCVLDGINLDYKTLNKVWLDNCFIKNIEINNALLENCRIEGKSSVWSNNADNTIFKHCLFVETGVLNNNIRNAQFDRCGFYKIFIGKQSFNNAENARFIKCHGVNIHYGIESFWNITIT